MDGGESSRFSDRLRQLRNAAGLTQEELAERAGISVKAVSALERGRRQRPYPNTVRALADALGLSDDERAELAGLTRERSRPDEEADRAPRPLFPVAPTPLIGRERELDHVSRLLRSGTARLVTLTGAGGVGKTRLAMEAALGFSGHVDGRVAFVLLAPLNDPALVMSTVAQTLGLPEAGDTSVGERLAAYLAGDAWLMVLDNVEHVLDAAPEVAGLLAACPGLTVLATGRAPLKIRVEHEYPLRPLELPELSSLPILEDVARASSVQLFLERAQAIAPDFELTQSNCAAVAAICRRLDGLPLALELVAARVRFLSPTELLARLDHVLPLLVGGSRDLPQRQQTMRAAINWSYELLEPAERALFRRLSVFVAGWTLDAAEAVVAWGEISTEEIIDLLAGLVEQSLVVAERSADGETRYLMLETIRQFAVQRVDEAGERVELSDRHLAWCLSLAQQAAPELRGPAQRHWLDRLEQEHDNLRAALSWCQQDESKRTAELQLATALWRFWETRGYLSEGRRWLEHALSASENVPADLRAEGLNAAGNLARDQGDQAQAVALYEASLALRRDLGDVYGMAQSLNNLGNMMLDQGQYRRASMLYAEALSYFRELDKAWDIANAVNNLGISLTHCGDYEQATRLLEEALALRERLGETASRARTLDALGVVMQKQGELERAGSLHEESLALRRELGDARGIAIALNNLALVARYRGDFIEATRLIEEALRMRETVGDRFGVVGSLSDLADVARRQGDIRRALDLYREALTMRQQIGIYEGLVDSLLGLAAIAVSGGDALRAARLLGAADALREATNQAVAPVDRAEYERTVDAIHESIGQEDYAAAHALGRSMTLGEAVADALGRHGASR